MQEAHLFEIFYIMVKSEKKYSLNNFYLFLEWRCMANFF